MRKHLDLVDESITLIIYNYFLAQFTRRCYPFIRLYPLIMQLNNNVRYSINSHAKKNNSIFLVLAVVL